MDIRVNLNLRELLSTEGSERLTHLNFFVHEPRSIVLIASLFPTFLLVMFLFSVRLCNAFEHVKSLEAWLSYVENAQVGFFDVLHT